MYVLYVSNENDSFINSTDNKNEDIVVIIKDLLHSIPGSKIILSLSSNILVSDKNFNK